MGMLEWVLKKQDLSFSEEEIRKHVEKVILTYIRVSEIHSSLFNTVEKRVFATSYSLYFQYLQAGRFDYTEIAFFCAQIGALTRHMKGDELDAAKTSLPIYSFAMDLSLRTNNVGIIKCYNNEHMFMRCFGQVKPYSKLFTSAGNVVFSFWESFDSDQKMNQEYEPFRKKVDEKISNIDQQWFNTKEWHQIEELYKSIKNVEHLVLENKK